MSLPFVLRDAVDSDLGFVQNSWRGTFHLGGFGAQDSDREHYHEEMTRLFERILKRARVRVACDTKDQDVLLGFAVATGRELHFVYVRQDFRRLGVARALVEDLDPKQFTFSTRQGVARLKPRERGWAFTPRWTIV